MTREEQMWEAVEQVHGNLSRREAFVTLTALEWADKTMIEKAKQWLIRGGYFVNSNETIEDFCKAMQNE